ncbi:MAG: TetR/AcrR family transcriptional regulator C-terminal domain-containing protein [Proteobacteria bacterium]|nr:TetR/AcrR family transcriptional regulator C-terminal domain-containing protein [Pseudomonadota bacterium]
MARTKGATNAGFEARRRELAERLRLGLAEGASPPPSLRELAARAGVSVSTLRHYFGSRDGLVRLVLALHAPGAGRHLAFLREPGDTFEESVRAAAAYIALGLKQQMVAELHRIGLAEGLGRPEIGRAYLIEILEPMIEALEARLAAHMDRGEMERGDPRVAALALISPLILAELHQGALGGAVTRPLDQDSFREAHCAAFIRGYRKGAA